MATDVSTESGLTNKTTRKRPHPVAAKSKSEPKGAKLTKTTQINELASQNQIFTSADACSGYVGSPLSGNSPKPDDLPSFGAMGRSHAILGSLVAKDNQASAAATNSTTTAIADGKKSIAIKKLPKNPQQKGLGTAKMLQQLHNRPQLSTTQLLATTTSSARLKKPTSKRTTNKTPADLSILNAQLQIDQLKEFLTTEVSKLKTKATTQLQAIYQTLIAPQTSSTCTLLTEREKTIASLTKLAEKLGVPLATPVSTLAATNTSELTPPDELTFSLS
jgi:hypothetical protein